MARFWARILAGGWVKGAGKVVSVYLGGESGRRGELSQVVATTGVKTKKGRRLGASAFFKTLGASIARNHQNQLRGQDSNL